MQRVGIPISSNIGGDVFESFTKLNDVIKKNDGIRSFSVKTNSCYDSDAPVYEGTQTHIRITNNFHDINQLGESYLRMKWNATVKFHDQIVSANNEPITYFIGWKNANEAIRQLEVENNNVDCEYLQTESMKEGCAYSAYMPQEEKVSRRFAHSTWEGVSHYEDGQAGTYITFVNTDTVGEHEKKDVKFETIIPITDLLAFQAFEEFPASLGDIVLKFYFSKQSMVYACVEQTSARDHLDNWLGNKGDGKDTVIQLTGTKAGTEIPFKAPYTRGFVQCGQESRQFRTMEDNIDNCASGFQTVSITELKLENCYCDVYGYNVTQECKRNIASLFTPEHPMIIPAQHLDVKQMPKLNNDDQYDADFTYALHNVTDFIVVWPCNNSDQTCFYNPNLELLQLRVDGKLFPTNKLENTWDYRFYQMMMNASDLDNYYAADKSYSDSLLAQMPKPTAQAWYINCCTPHDISTFLCTFQVERNTAGYCFDGIETGNQTVNIALTYKSANSWYKVVKIAPQIWFTRDTYWTCDNVNGLKYHKTGTPPIYASSED